MEIKRLYRPEDDRALLGVCSGIARYFDTDPIVIRLLYILLALTAGAGIVFYLLAAAIIPTESKVKAQGAQADPAQQPGYGAEAQYADSSAAADAGYTEDTAEGTQTVYTSDGTAYENRAAQPEARTYTYTEPEPARTAPAAHSKARKNLGLLLIIVGIIVVAKILFRSLNLRLVVAIAAIFYGIYLFFKKPE
ncbi:MAG: PspC domain-containing protein [Firmicutes bacterium]|nr:PspC domain-containing protein [Bacillota bacterium]